MIRYTVAPDQVAHNEELLRTLFAELAELRPDGLRYEAFKLADGVSFIHLVSHDKPGHGPVPHLHALKAFHTGLHERCDQRPARTELTGFGTYHPLDA
ncbi:MAG TPA: hypothetical protein VGO10_17360 [Baekduia sp.]|jgi:hypothetical protein|nr:hypothetical protein [Baekduia sp.]